MCKSYRNQPSSAQTATNQAHMGQGQQNTTGRNGMGNAAHAANGRVGAMDTVAGASQMYGNSAAIGAMSGPDSEATDTEPTTIIGVPVLHRRTAPTQGSIADLASPGGVAALSAADWVHIPANPSVWISLMELEASDRETLTLALTDFCTTEGFDPSTSFEIKDGSIILGQPTSHFEFDGNTASAQTVLNDSNDIRKYRHQADKPIFDYLNGGYSELNREQVWDELRVGHKETPTDEKKPASWYNGYVIKGDWVVAETSPLDKRNGKDHPERMPLDEYQKMLVRDFNFNGAITLLESLGGESAFTEAMTSRFAEGHKLGDDAFKALCHEIWLYATTGMGSEETTDIAKMQGMLRQLSPDIQNSSDSNNPSGPDFKIPGTNESIASSDGKHGRATVLETRHLLAGLMTEPTPPQSIALSERQITERDFYVRDATGSWNSKWETLHTGLDQEFGFAQGNGIAQRSLAEIHEHKIDMKAGQNQQKKDMPQALRDCYSRIHPNNDANDRASFASLFGLQPSKVFKRSGELKAEKLMRLIGDKGDTDYGGRGESGLKGIIMTLLYSNEFSTQLAAAVKNEESPPRINAIIDEPEQSMEYLKLAQALSDAMGVEARIIAVPTKKINDFASNPNKHIQYINIDDITIHADNTVTYHYNQDGVEHTNGKTKLEQDKYGQELTKFGDQKIKYMTRPD